jgi:serine/threonine-protein phosphatase 2A regulatory subunit A
VLVIIADQLGDFVQYVGGPEHAACLLEPLENLAAVEETVVREKATESMCTCISAIADASESAVPMIVKLANGEWFTSKISACGMFGAAYPRTANTERRAELRQ